MNKETGSPINVLMKKMIEHQKKILFVYVTQFSTMNFMHFNLFFDQPLRQFFVHTILLRFCSIRILQYTNAVRCVRRAQRENRLAPITPKYTDVGLKSSFSICCLSTLRYCLISVHQSKQLFRFNQKATLKKRNCVWQKLVVKKCC